MFTLNEIEEIARDARRRAKWKSGALLLVDTLAMTYAVYYIYDNIAPGNREAPLLLVFVATCMLIYFTLSLPRMRYKATKRRLRKANTDEEMRRREERGEGRER